MPHDPTTHNRNELEVFEMGPVFMAESLQALGSLISGSRYPRGIENYIRRQRRIDIRNVPVLWYHRLLRSSTTVHPLYNEAIPEDMVYAEPVPAHIYVDDTRAVKKLTKFGRDDESGTEFGISLIEAIRLGVLFGLTDLQAQQFNPLDLFQRGGEMFEVIEFDVDKRYGNTAQPLTWKGTAALHRPESNAPTSTPDIREDEPQVMAWPVP